MAETAISAHFDETLDVHRDFFAQIAFHGAFIFDQGTNLVDLVLGQVGDLLFGIDASSVQQREGPGTPDSVDIREADRGPLLRW